MKALRKPLSLFMALLMCLGVFVGTGTTAFAAGETMTTYMIDLPRANDPNKAGWGHPALNFMGGWSTGENDSFSVHTQDAFNGRAIYCIEPGVGVNTGDQYTGRGEDFWDNYPSNLNPTIPPDTIKEYIGRIMTYGWQGNASTSWMSGDPEDASKIAGYIAKQVVEISLVNERVYGDLRLTKVDKDYPDNKLTGAEFEVYRDTNGNKELDEGDELLGKLEETSTGIYEMSHILYGGVFVKETKAPEGFLLDENAYYAQYFVGNSYLNPLTVPGQCPVFLANVTFEPGCRNNWHVHRAKSGGGQLLICTAGEGWYQEEGKAAVSLTPGTVITIPANVKHWHGAKKDSWFSHIAVEVPGEETANEWLEAVSDEAYARLD